MTKLRIKPGLMIVLASTLAVTGAIAASAGEQVRCIDDWSVGAALVKDHGLVSVEELTRLAKSKLAGKIIKTTLCNTKSGYAYRLVVRSKKGRLSTVNLDARQPFPTKTKAP